MGDRGQLGQFEQSVLLALVHLRGEAYGMKVRQEVEKRTGRRVSIGAVYTTLERLQDKGFVTSRRGEPTAQRGGKAKRYFKINAPGLRALNQSRQLANRMWLGFQPARA
jgi:PadR family transcriptional regulator